MKGHEIMTHAATWVSPEDMLSEISQSQKDKYHATPLHAVSRVVKFRVRKYDGGQ